MMIPGEIVKHGTHYAALLEPLGVYGQGRTRAAARQALASAILEHVTDRGPLNGFTVEVTDDGETTLYVTSNDSARMIALLLRRQRELHEMSLADIAAATKAKSRNGWAQYEHGRCEPSFAKLEEMLSAVAPELAIAIIPRTARVIPRWDDEAADFEEIERLLDDPTPANVEALRVRLKARPRVHKPPRKRRRAA